MSPQIPAGPVPSSVTRSYQHFCQLLGGTPGEIVYCRFHDQQVDVVDDVDTLTGTYTPKPGPRCIETGGDLYLVATVRRDGVPL